MKRVISTLILSLLLLWIAACNPSPTPEPPAPEQPKVEVQEAKPTDTPPPAPTQTPEPLPPVVLRTVPEVGQEQPVDMPVEISFDQPMDRDSVEKAFAIEPGASVDGKFEWIDDQTVHFTLNDGFARDQHYRVRVIESARSQAGLGLARPFE